MFLTGVYQERKCPQARWVAIWRSRTMVRYCRRPIGVNTREAAMEWAMGDPPAPRCQQG
jgi:hypothetical protein